MDQHTILATLDRGEGGLTVNLRNVPNDQRRLWLIVSPLRLWRDQALSLVPDVDDDQPTIDILVPQRMEGWANRVIGARNARTSGAGPFLTVMRHGNEVTLEWVHDVTGFKLSLTYGWERDGDTPSTPNAWPSTVHVQWSSPGKRPFLDVAQHFALHALHAQSR